MRNTEFRPQKGFGMYQKGQKQGTIRFKVTPGHEAVKAALAGDFTDWKPKAMRRRKDGVFAVTVPVQPGRHRYKYLIDGDWMTDPDISAIEPNCYGTFDSVAVVE
jgi:1,4-alpha-glucan branching enzyme